MKFKDLSPKIKNKVASDYIKGWQETHENDIIDLDEIYKILSIDLIDDEYDKYGNLIEND